MLERVARSPLPPYHDVPPAVARRLYHDTRSITSPRPPEMGAVYLMLVPGPAGPLPTRVYRPAGVPKGEILPALVYYHGGGWVIGDLDTHDACCRRLAKQAGARVLSVDYRLAPENPFPASHDDCIDEVRHGAQTYHPGQYAGRAPNQQRPFACHYPAELPSAAGSCRFLPRLAGRAATSGGQ